MSVSSGTGNSVLSNQIFGNTGLGIDLGGSSVTLNDTGDPDTGANNLQNFLVITSVESGIATTITGTLNSNPSQTYTIQCYLSDGDGYGEGQTLLDTKTTTTDANGNANFACGVPGRISGQVSATATSTTSGDTSEFSQNALVIPRIVTGGP